jgi:hypothetical protein
MFISYTWLNRHVDLTGISPHAIARNLTLQTAEVEGVEPFAPALADVVVGHVLSWAPNCPTGTAARSRSRSRRFAESNPSE